MVVSCVTRPSSLRFCRSSQRGSTRQRPSSAVQCCGSRRSRYRRSDSQFTSSSSSKPSAPIDSSPQAPASCRPPWERTSCTALRKSSTLVRWLRERSRHRHLSSCAAFPDMTQAVAWTTWRRSWESKSRRSLLALRKDSVKRRRRSTLRRRRVGVGRQRSGCAVHS